MASSGLQLFAFFLALLGLAGTIAATFIADWKHQSDKIYEGLWMKCYGKTECEFHESLFKLSEDIQATRAGMMTSILLSAGALLMSVVGMKCTRFMDQRTEAKSCFAMTGGIIFMVAGLLSLIITSWYAHTVVQSFNMHHDEGSEIGNAVFFSWAGSLLTLIGGAFLSCRRCSRKSESIRSNHLLPQSHAKSNYV